MCVLSEVLIHNKTVRGYFRRWTQAFSTILSNKIKNKANKKEEDNKQPKKLPNTLTIKIHKQKKYPDNWTKLQRRKVKGQPIEPIEISYISTGITNHYI